MIDVPDPEPGSAKPMGVTGPHTDHVLIDQARKAVQGRRPLVGADPSATATAAAISKPGAKIGDYTIIRELGRGGFGVVYEAQQESPRRAVALKVIRGGQYVDEQQVRLFQREAHALARLKHPCIGAIYEAGRTEDGQHYFAMELVRGRPLTEHAREAGLSIPQRLQLFRQICEAIHYAHQKGVMHRDLKPSNILIDADGSPKILDFGLAKITDADVAATTVVTEVGRIAGTLPYMSPEQARGHADEIDTRSDVYSLGVILYELLTGALPYNVSRTMLHEAVRIICEEAPRRPSTIVRVLRGDLETIALKALEKDPRRRYASAAALSEDIQRYLTDQPILARPASAAYQFRKLVARHKAPFGFAAAMFIVVTAFGIWMSVLYAQQRRERQRADEKATEAVAARDEQVKERRRADEQRRLAESNEKKAQTAAHKSEQVAKFLTEMLQGVGPAVAQGRDTTLLREILDKTDQRARTELKDQPEVEGAILSAIGGVYYQIHGLDKAEAIYTEVLRLTRTAFGEEHVDVAFALHNIAEVRQSRGDLDGAEKLESEVLAMRQRLLGENHPDVAWSINRLALIKDARRQLPEAESLYRKALAIMQHVHAADHPDVAIMLNNLSMGLYRRGAADEAEKMLRKAIEMLRRLSGNLHPTVAHQVENLGILLCMRGRLAEAEAMFRETLTTRTRVYGAGSPDTMTAIDHLVNVLLDEGKLEEAEVMLREAVTTTRADLPGSQRAAISLTRHLADVLRRRGKLDDALRLAGSAVKAYLAQPDADPVLTAFAFATLIQTLANAGNTGESDAERQRELDWLHKALAPDDSRLASALALTASVLLDIGDYESAESNLRECLGICKTTAFQDVYSQGWLTCTSTSMLGEAIAEGTQPQHEKVRGKIAAIPASLPGESNIASERARPAANDRLTRLDQAERLLLEGYDGVKEMQYVYWPAKTCRADCKRRALERIVRLYDIRHAAEPDKAYDAKATEWRAKLAAYQATTQSAVRGPTTTQSAPPITATQVPTQQTPHAASQPSRSL